MTAKIDMRNEKIFLTRNRLDERSILFTTRLPSMTTCGILEKSDSNKTTCAAWAVASLPDAIAILQSASFMAKISLTPSPVIATVLPSFCSTLTNIFFCSGVTRPNTVCVLTACAMDSTVVNSLASMYSSACLTPATLAIWLTVAGLSPEMTLTSTPC